MTRWLHRDDVELVNRRLVLGMLAACAVAALLLFVTRMGAPRHAQDPAVKLPSESKTPAIVADQHGLDRAANIQLENLGAVSLREVSDLLRSRRSADVETLALDLQKLRTGTRASAAITQFFKAWVEIDASAALRTALKFSDVVMRETALNALFANVAPAAAGKLTREYADASQDTISSRSRSNLLGDGIVKWSEADPAAAAQFLDQHPEAAIGWQGVPVAGNRVASNWAMIDPVAAIDWARKQSDTGVIQGAIGGWWEKDPGAAAVYAQQHLGTFEEQKLAEIVASRMATQDPKRAAAWVAQLPSDARVSAEMGVAFAWARRDPQAASEWATGLLPEERKHVLGPVAAQWSLSDPQAAGRWLSSLEGPGRDEAVGTYSGAIAGVDPQAAVSWASTMSDGRMRNDTLQRILSGWYNRDPQSAKNWLAQSNLSADEKSRFLKIPPGP